MKVLGDWPKGRSTTSPYPAEIYKLVTVWDRLPQFSLVTKPERAAIFLPTRANTVYRIEGYATEADCEWAMNREYHEQQAEMVEAYLREKGVICPKLDE